MLLRCAADSGQREIPSVILDADHSVVCACGGPQMPNPNSPPCPYHDHPSDSVCPKYEKTNRVSVTKQDGHIESEEYYCANCLHMLGQWEQRLH